MPARSWIRPAFFACLALAFASSAAGRSREALYQWTDATGAVRYTTRLERIPDDRRDAAVQVVAGATAAPRAVEPAPTAPVVPAAEPTPAQPPVDAAAPAAPIDPKLAELDAQIAALEQSIAKDEAALADYISDPDRATRQPAQPESDDIATIADRLPRLQNELRQLRERRAAATGTQLPHGP